LNIFGLSIKDIGEDSWDFNSPGYFSVFLDVKFCFTASAGLLTDINIKPTDARVYLHFSSHHPKSTFPSIVYSQCLRYKRIINCGATLWRRLDELKQCFIKSGYPPKMMDGIINDVLKRPRNLYYSKKDSKPPAPILWVQTFSPETSKVKQLVRDTNRAIQKSAAWKDERKAICVVSRRGKNLGDLILQRKKFALDSLSGPSGTSRCTPIPSQETKRSRGRPCEACPLMSNSSVITSSVTKKSFVAPNGNCKSKNLIYVARCKICIKQYVGRTSNKLQKRISGHRSFVSQVGHSLDEVGDSDDAALVTHLHSDHNFVTITADSFNSNFEFSIVETDPSDLYSAERIWISRLVTMRPFGLNIEKPGGIADSMHSMARRSLHTYVQ
jgi:hypothetical protein